MVDDNQYDLDRLLQELTTIWQDIEHVELSKQSDLLIHKINGVITEQIKGKQLLLRVMEDITDSFFVLDRDWRIIYANKAVYKEIPGFYAGYLGKSIWELYPSTVGTDLFYELTGAVAENRQTNFCYQGFDSKKIMAVYVYPTANSGLFMLLKDAVASGEPERPFKGLTRRDMIGQMAVGVAHEIRNPMTVIKGYLQLLQQRIPDQVEERFHLILAELEHIESLVTDLIYLANNKAVQVGKKNLNTIINSMIPVIKTEADPYDIQLEVHLTEDLPDMLLDENEIKQLILNLTRNATEAMEPGGRLTIKTKPDKARICLQIQDQGYGMVIEQMEKIFDPFYTTKSNRSGLGLAICLSIIERHRGKVEVTSELGKGTVFQISFPASTE